MQVRAARVEDRERLLELWERSVRATHDFLTESDIVALRPLVAEELAGHAVDWWVLVSGAEELIGFMGFANDTIEALFIDPDRRGQGGGKALVAHAQSLAGGALAGVLGRGTFGDRFGWPAVPHSAPEASSAGGTVIVAVGRLAGYARSVMRVRRMGVNPA